MKVIKTIIPWLVGVACFALSILVGWFIANKILPNIGANMIRPGDIAGCYWGSILIIGGAGVILALYIDDKIN